MNTLTCTHGAQSLGSRGAVAFLWVLLGSLTAVHGELRIGFVDPAAPQEPPRRNAAALAFARTQGTIMRLRPHAEGGWQAAESRVDAPEEFDVLWYHQGDDPAAVTLPEAVVADLYGHLELGGTLLLSGAAGRTSGRGVSKTWSRGKTAGSWLPSSGETATRPRSGSNQARVAPATSNQHAPVL